MICPICEREATTEFYGVTYCEECAEALSDEYTALPLDRVPGNVREDCLTLEEIERCYL